MSTVARIVARKGSRIIDVPAAVSLADAARIMAAEGVGALVVRDGVSFAGILSERDVVLRLAEQGAAAAGVAVREAMQAAVEIDGEADLEQAMALMTDRRRRHLLVRSEGRVLGLVSIGDLVKALHDEQVGTITSLHRYITAG